MHLAIPDLIVIALYFIGLTAFGIVVRRTKGFEDFSVARRSVPATMVFASLCGAFIGPGYSLGVASKAYTTGFLLLAGWLFFSLQTCVVGIWLAPRLRRFSDAYTLGGVMATAYGPIAQRLTGLVSVGLCIGFAAVVTKAGGTILSSAVGISLTSAIFLITGVGVIYAWTGGLKSVIATEGIQFTVVLTAMGATLLFASSRIQSWPALDQLAMSTTSSAWHATPGISLVGLPVLFLLGETLIPPYANRALAADSERSSQKGFIAAGLFSVVWFCMLTAAGIMSKTLLGLIPNPDNALILLAAAVLPEGLLGLFLVALAAIVMSTQESLLNAASVCLTRDLLPTNGNHSDRSQLLTARGATLVFGLLVVFFALRAPAIIDGILVCYSIWAPTVLPALIWILLGLPTERWAGVGSIVCGGIASGGVLLAKIGNGDPAIAILVGLIGSTAGAFLGFMVGRIWGE